MNYSPDKVTVLVAGVPVVGFSPDTMIKAARRNDKNSLIIGCKGDGDFCESADDSGEVTISLKHTSASNGVFKALFESKQEFNFAVIDANNGAGDLGVAGSRCKFKTEPDWERGKEIGTMEWVLLVEKLKSAFKNATAAG